ncbi:DUF4188 domain-containing protein [Microlunatus soli]|uniref:DUF4188 domain-containing protein n=1 Tax=Microlunatus soli TaxID=630515 RepID=A0A1H1XNT1_9ACTN|nr:DUF4188 domain-containing protein [Microlunatus soli]SDT10833.1 protein of unknown function [Microlunatus soli]
MSARTPSASNPDGSNRTAIKHGRMTHDYDGDLVVFLIGMTINKWWRIDKWLPVFRAMPRMLAELSRDKESGLLGYRLIFDLRGPWLVQYWKSLDKLYGYASDPQASHRPAWAAFNRSTRDGSGAVGVWHETYPVAKAESIYVHTRPQGLATATAIRPVSRRMNSARERIDGAGDSDRP